MKKTKQNINWKEVKNRINNAKNSSRRNQALTGYKIAEILQTRAEEIAKANVNESEKEEKTSLIEFELGQERYAIETKFLKEVSGTDKIYDLPCTPNHIYGVINLRGKIVTVIDLKKYLGLKYKGINDNTSIIITEFEEKHIGIVADKLIGIKDVALNKIKKSKPKLQNIKEAFLKGITDETIIVLDVIKLLEDKSLQVNDSIL